MTITYYADSKGQKWRVYNNVFGSMVRQEPVIEDKVDKVDEQPVVITDKPKKSRKVK